MISLLVASVVAPAVSATEPDREDKGSSQTPVQQAVSDGSFAALTTPARVGSTRAFAWGLGGYDFSRQGPVFDTTGEVQVWGPIALRGGAVYSGGTSRMRPSVGARVQILHQEAHGIDGALSVFFKAEGFTEPEGEIETVASIGRRFDALSVIGNLVYGQDPEGNERDGEVRLTVFRPTGRFSLGVDSRARFAIGAQRGRLAATEPKFDAMGAPLATVVVGPIVLIAEAGLAAFSMAGTAKAGLVAFGGAGTAF